MRNLFSGGLVFCGYCGFRCESGFIGVSSVFFEVRFFSCCEIDDFSSYYCYSCSSLSVIAGRPKGAMHSLIIYHGLFMLPR